MATAAADDDDDAVGNLPRRRTSRAANVDNDLLGVHRKLGVAVRETDAQQVRRDVCHVLGPRPTAHVSPAGRYDP